MSKFPKCREILIHEPLCIGTLLHKHNHQAQKTSNLKLRASITLALKTLSAAVSECTVNEGLEEDGEGVMRHELGLELGLDEGEVSTLISSSFEVWLIYHISRHNLLSIMTTQLVKLCFNSAACE